MTQNFKNIVMHWTGGNYKPCSDDIEHYHFLIDINGKIIQGKYSITENLDCKDEIYARHCGGGNTGGIGVAICCRKDLKTLPMQKQIESMCKFCAELCFILHLKPSNCITHAEFGQAHPDTSSYGKIDINSIPYARIEGIKECGDYLRNKIQWYYNKLYN